MENKEIKGLTMEGNNITITLGDDVDLGEIVDFLENKTIITKEEEKDENGNFTGEYHYHLTENNEEKQIIIKICGNDKHDEYSLEIDAKEYCFLYLPKDKTIAFNIPSSQDAGYYLWVYENNHIWHAPHTKETDLLNGSVYHLIKDIKGNLSWFKITIDGNVYMCNAKGKDSNPEKIEDNWLPIRHTFWSNIYNYYKSSIKDYNKQLQEETSAIKRFGRLIACQQNMTGNWLCGKGCFSFTPSYYNEYDYYEQLDNAKSKKDVNSPLNQNNKI